MTAKHRTKQKAGEAALSSVAWPFADASDKSSLALDLALPGVVQ